MKTLITGAAGTGKTTRISQIIHRNPDKRILVMAPTHQALNVLRSKIKSDNTTFKTIHGALRARPSYYNFDIVYAVNRKNADILNTFDIVIVDEASMVQKNLAEIIHEKTETELVVVGDHYQLPPVNEKEPQFFKLPYDEKIHLTQIHRQEANNTVAKIAMQPENVEQLLSEDSQNVFRTENIDDVLDKIIHENYTYLAYTNRKVDSVNRIVKSMLGIDQMIVPGMTIIMDSIYKDFYTNKRVKVETIQNKKDIIRINGERFELRTVIVNDKLRILHEESIDDFYEVLAITLIEKKTDMFHKLYNRYAWFKYSWAMTVHKSQGSTLDNVIIDINNIKRAENNIIKPLLYVAATRTSGNNLIYIDKNEKTATENSGKDTIA